MTGRSLTRRASVLGFTAGALALTMTGTAYGCTYTFGKFTLTAKSPATGLVSTAFADGAGGGAIHSYCPTPAPVDNITGGASEIAYPTQGLYKAAQFTVQIGRTTTCTGTNTAKLGQNDLTDSEVTQAQIDANASDGTYQVRWLNLTANNLEPTDGELAALCFNETLAPKTTSPGSIAVVNGVAGPATFTQGASAAGDLVTVCAKKGTDPNQDNGAAPPQVKLKMI